MKHKHTDFYLFICTSSYYSGQENKVVLDIISCLTVLYCGVYSYSDRNIEEFY